MATNAPGPVVPHGSAEPQTVVVVSRGLSIITPDAPLVLSVGIDDKSRPFVQIEIGNEIAVQAGTQALDPYEKIKVYEDQLAQPAEIRWEVRSRQIVKKGKWETSPNGWDRGSQSLSQREFLAITLQREAPQLEAALRENYLKFATFDLDRLEQFLNKTFGTQIRALARSL